MNNESVVLQIHFGNTTVSLEDTTNLQSFGKQKLTSMFRLKDNNIHPSHVVYHGTCADCSASYIGESYRNFETRKQEHEDATKQSEPTRHLRENPYHHFNWRVITIAHPLGIRRILESMFIAKFQPCLNKQVHSYTLNLFPKGIT